MDVLTATLKLKIKRATRLPRGFLENRKPSVYFIPCSNFSSINKVMTELLLIEAWRSWRYSAAFAPVSIRPSRRGRDTFRTVPHHAPPHSSLFWSAKTRGLLTALWFQIDSAACFWGLEPVASQSRLVSSYTGHTQWLGCRHRGQYT